ncbi:MAG: hypothetical protein ACOYOE_09130 [Chlorobium sp.]
MGDGIYFFFSNRCFFCADRPLETLFADLRGGEYNCRCSIGTISTQQELWHHDREALLDAGYRLQEFVATELKLLLKPFCLNSPKTGLPFLGYLLEVLEDIAAGRFTEIKDPKNIWASKNISIFLPRSNLRINVKNTVEK